MAELKCYRCGTWNGAGCGCADGITLVHGDCREVLPVLPKVDLVLTDPPYGITANSWDQRLDLSYLWLQLQKVAIENAAFVITASQPFTAELVTSNRQNFRHEWIWIKDRGSNFANTVREPFKEHESVLVFSKGKWIYNPQRQPREAAGAERIRHAVSSRTGSDNYRKFPDRGAHIMPEDRCPSSWQKFNRDRGLHPTQKPLKLMEYMIRTYSNEGQTVLDLFAGSGTTLVAAKQLGRKAIGIEIEEKYCQIAASRLRQSILPFSS